MKQFSLTRLVIFLRAFIVILITFLVVYLLSAFTVNKYTDDLWKQLGLSQQAGTESIKTSFLNNYFQYYDARNAKNIAMGNRTAVAKDLLAYCKKYISSEAFKTAYEKLRMDAKPAEPEKKSARGKEEIRKEKITEMEEAKKKLELSMKDMTADMQQLMKTSMDYYEQQIKDYKDPKSQMIDLFVTAEKFQIEAATKQYEENLKKWELDYPADVKKIICQRLQHYLDLSATVDFSAALLEKKGKKFFAKPVYEGKPYDWKMIFRAGKEINDVARPFAQQWLNEIK